MRVIKNIVLFMMVTGFLLAPAEAQNFSASYKFMKAVKEQDYREIKVAIEKGVNINTRDYDDDTTPLIIATKKKDVSLAGYLISNGAKTDLYGKDGKVPLLIAAAGGDNAMVDLLIKEGADLNFADDNGTTPLIAAVLARKDQIVVSLLKAGADYTLEDYSGRSPLQHAIDGRRRNAEKLLKDAGAVR